MLYAFRTKYSADSSDFYSNPGVSFVPDYGFATDKQGMTELVVIGETNLDEFIQSNKDSGDISLLLKRLEAGDVNALNQVSSSYADVRGIPTNYPELVALINEARNTFEGFDPEVKELFNNNPDEFYSQYGSEEFFNKLSTLGPVDKVDKSVIDDNVVIEKEKLTNE